MEKNSNIDLKRFKAIKLNMLLDHDCSSPVFVDSHKEMFMR
jgi:hypothetical protein